MLTMLDGHSPRQARQAYLGWNETALNLYWNMTKSLSR